MTHCQSRNCLRKESFDGALIVNRSSLDNQVVLRRIFSLFFEKKVNSFLFFINVGVWDIVNISNIWRTPIVKGKVIIFKLHRLKEYQNSENSGRVILHTDTIPRVHILFH